MKAVVALFLLLCSVTANAALTIRVFDWHLGTMTVFMECDISLWNAEAYIDRSINDANYLGASCVDFDDGVPLPGDGPRYETRGLLHDEVALTAPGRIANYVGCYVTHHSFGGVDEDIRIECPGRDVVEIIDHPNNTRFVYERCAITPASSLIASCSTLVTLKLDEEVPPNPTIWPRVDAHITRDGILRSWAPCYMTAATGLPGSGVKYTLECLPQVTFADS